MDRFFNISIILNGLKMWVIHLSHKNPHPSAIYFEKSMGREFAGFFCTQSSEFRTPSSSPGMNQHCIWPTVFKSIQYNWKCLSLVVFTRWIRKLSVLMLYWQQETLLGLGLLNGLQFKSFTKCYKCRRSEPDPMEIWNNKMISVHIISLFITFMQLYKEI